MKSTRFLISVFCLFYMVSTSAQSVNLNKYNKEREKILNTIINSIQFDSIYSLDRVYFAENKLLTESTSLILKKGNCKVKIFERSKLKQKKKEYVSIADFIMLKENPNYVRVQIYSSLTRKTLNLRLEKNKNDWLIVNHLIMKD